jgi:hypothetical protein|tara:strand:- start:16159 stop:16473 length:315 start_codon:yes stop_codon:yes gene_type:complete
MDTKSPKSIVFDKDMDVDYYKKGIPICYPKSQIQRLFNPPKLPTLEEVAISDIKKAIVDLVFLRSDSYINMISDAYINSLDAFIKSNPEENRTINIINKGNVKL